MLGRVRPLSSSSVSLDSLERPSPKIVKHDSLSIYEATIMRLKLASQRDDIISSIRGEPMTTDTDATSTSVSESSQNGLSSPSMDAIEMETNGSSVSSSKGYIFSLSTSTYEEQMAFDATAISPACSDCRSMINSVKQQGNKNLSIADMFSNYKGSQNAQSSVCEEKMEDNCSSSDAPSMGSM